MTMIEIQSIADLELLRESVDLECKLAAGRDGRGTLPEDFWPTYSSFANTPVHLTNNPFAHHTFRRLNDGDRPLPDDEVKRMLAEQVEDSRDDRVLCGYDIADLEQTTFRAYRQVFANRDPNHPWNVLPDHEFLRQIGGWRKDRETGENGITAAGLLMFGQMASIQDEFPNYMLDYQERAEAKAELRWVDRLTLDGKWSGNLYDFYRKVYLKLTGDLKVPFALEKGERKDETPVHEALREALANVLVHADYSDRASVLVVKRPDMFGDSSEQSSPSSAYLHNRSAHLRGDTATEEHRDAEGRLLTDQLDAPVIDSLDTLDQSFRARLEALAIKPRTKGKLPVETMQEVVLTICTGHYVTLNCLALLVDRDPDAFRQQHLKLLAKDGKLRLAFPTAPTHAKQAYRTAE